MVGTIGRTYFFRAWFVGKPISSNQKYIRVWFPELDVLVTAAHDHVMKQLEEVFVNRHFSFY